MAILKAVYDSQDDIPEAHRELFSERGGKWELTGIEGIKTTADTERIEGALKKERERATEAERKLKAFRDVDPEKVHADLDELAELRTLKDAGKIEGEQLEAAVQARLNREINPLKRELEARTKERDEAVAARDEFAGTIRTSKINDAIRSAAATAKVRPEAVDDLLLYGSMFDVTEDGAVITKDKVGVTPGMGVDVWLSDMKDKRPHWWPETVGGGSTGGKGAATSADNPFAKGKFNMASASELIRSNPDKAMQYARQAGFESPEAAAAEAAKAL